jgi:hypothetical protein
VHLEFRVFCSRVSIAKRKRKGIAFAVQPHIIDGPTIDRNGCDALGGASCTRPQSLDDTLEYCLNIPAQSVGRGNGSVRKYVATVSTAGPPMTSFALCSRICAYHRCGTIPVNPLAFEGFQNKSFIFRFDLLTHHFHFWHLPSLLFSSRQFPADAGKTRVPKASTHRRPGYTLPLSSGLRLTPGTRRRPQHLPACRFASD